MGRKAAFAFVVAFAISAAIRASSRALTGHSEPWHVEGVPYCGSPTVAGAIAGALVPQPHGHIILVQSLAS